MQGRKLLLYRQALGLTQQDAARLMGVSRQSWINWEKEVHSVPGSVILALEAMTRLKQNGELKAFLEAFEKDASTDALHEEKNI